MRRLLLSEEKSIRVLGRTTNNRDPLTLFWTGSGIEMNVTGTELVLEMTAGFDNYEPWIEIIIDGSLSQRRMLDRGEQKVCVFRAMDKGPVRHVKILKSTQAPSQDDASFLQINAIWTDGEFIPLEPPARRIEVIGDSLTSGEAMNGAPTENSWNASVFGVFGSYHYLLGEAMRADVHVISQSGYGVYCGWCGDTRESVPQYYEQVCGPLKGEKNEALGALGKWDFSSWQPDAILINLGTNDSGSFGQAGNYIADRDWRCPMRVNPDGSMNEEDRQSVLSAAIDFLFMLRRNNPESYLLWCIGMLPVRLEDTLREAVQTYARRTGDEKAEFVLLPRTEEGEFGARRHPGPASHRKTAAALEEKLRSLLGAE